MHIAVDLGAGSGRVFLVAFDPEQLFLEEIHRFVYPPREAAGHLRWDFQLIFGEIKQGLVQSAVRARELGREISSLGVDSWAVDYGWIGKDGRLLADPICYRDDRTDGVPEKVFERMPRRVIFEKTGIQTQRFNTIFQLVTDEADLTTRAASFLLLPDLINYELTGKARAEFTNATTTQLVSAATRNWDDDLLEITGIHRGSVSGIIDAGTNIGKLKPDLARELGLQDVDIIAPATHDTASAVAAAPIDETTAYISSGTWSLVGIESDKAIINDRAAAENFTNEGGVYDTFRFLKNVMGLWIFETCRREWQADGVDVGYETLLLGMPDEYVTQALIFVDDPRFLNPPSMVQAIRQQLDETGQAMPANPTFICKMIFDSLAFRYASVLRSIERISCRRLSGIEILGGGGRNSYLNQMTANACGLDVHAGLTEATVTGNALVQAITTGRFSSIAEGRRFIKENIQRGRFAPAALDDMASARKRYLAMESRFIADEATAA